MWKNWSFKDSLSFNKTKNWKKLFPKIWELKEESQCLLDLMFKKIAKNVSEKCKHLVLGPIPTLERLGKNNQDT